MTPTYPGTRRFYRLQTGDAWAQDAVETLFDDGPSRDLLSNIGRSSVRHQIALKVFTILIQIAKRVFSRAVKRLGISYKLGTHLHLAPINWLRSDAGMPPMPFNQPSLILPHLANRPRWSHLKDLQEADLCAHAKPLDRAIDPLPTSIAEPFAQTPKIARLHLAGPQQVKTARVHVFRDVLFANRGDRFCIMRGDRVDAQSTALPGPAMAQQIAAGRVTPIRVMAYCGDRHNPGNPAHFVADQLTRGLILRDTYGVASEDIYLPETSAPLNQVMQHALDSGFQTARPGHVYSVGSLVMSSDSLGAHSHSHPFHYCDAELMAEMAAAAESAVGAASGHGRKIYLSRMGMRRRPLSNEAELQAALEAEGFTTIRMEALDGVGQLGAIMRADVIVAPHGGALTSLFAAKPGSRCIEMFHPQKGTVAFAMIAARRGLNYAPVFGEPLSGDAWRVDIPEVLAAIRGD